MKNIELFNRELSDKEHLELYKQKFKKRTLFSRVKHFINDYFDLCKIFFKHFYLKLTTLSFVCVLLGFLTGRVIKLVLEDIELLFLDIVIDVLVIGLVIYILGALLFLVLIPISLFINDWFEKYK